jgi:carbamoyl-phosphate synthase large subunit
MANPKRVLVTGAAGAPALNYIRSLRMASEPFHLIGADCNRYQLLAAATDERHLVPRASDPDYIPTLRQLAEDTGAEFIFTQPDVELAVVSARREELPLRTFLPRAETVALCHNKWSSYAVWRDAGIPVPATRLIESEIDLRDALNTWGDVWLRADSGAAGRGSFRTCSFDHARLWLETNDGWGNFTAAQYLSPDTVTWQSIWNEGELVVAQSRRRLQWEFADRAPSGVTGITGAGLTVRDAEVDEIAMRAILAIDSHPHGVFAVDMTRDADGVPNPTEINIGRFFTTTLFFTHAGLNMPYILTRLAFGETVRAPEPRVNPLEPGLLWLRGMDREPVLTHIADADAAFAQLQERLARLHARSRAA